MIEHPVQWTTMPPLWPETAAAPASGVRATFNRPAILRFASDDFMEQFMTILEKDPRQLTGLIARHETWRKPAPSPKAADLLEPPKTPESSIARKLSRLRITADRLPSNGSQATSTQQLPEFKLYQPAHQRYYLVTASLVCGISGLPDKTVDPGRQEKVGFVIRRMFPAGHNLSLSATQLDNRLEDFDPGTWVEHAFVVSARGSGWQKVANEPGSTPSRLVPGEEKLPLFAVNYTEDDGRRRRMFASVIPVGKRETYIGAGKYTPSSLSQSPSGELPKTARKIHFRKQVAEPWKGLIRQVFDVRNQIGSAATPPSSESAKAEEQKKDLILRTREQIQTASWYILLEFAEYLREYLPEVMDVVEGLQAESTLTTTAQTNLLNALKNTKLRDSTSNLSTSLIANLKAAPYNATAANFPAASLLEALRDIGRWKTNNLEKVSVAYVRPVPSGSLWPTVLFPLTDPAMRALDFPSGTPLTTSDVDVDPDVFLAEEFEATLKAARDEELTAVDKLVAVVVRALPTESEKTAPAMPLAAQPVGDSRDGWFVIRCVFEHSACGPLDPAVLSDPTEAFQMAGFFDPDAPARPIRIALPIDTTPEGLRKFDKNTAFMISDVLCGQIQRLKGLTLGDLVLSVLPWPFHKSLPDVTDKGPCKSGDPALQLGMMCSLSIPIVTICALILLMIIVSILDYFFRWIPYLIMCFPLPGFKAKKKDS